MMLVKVVAVPPDSDMLSKRSHDVCYVCGNRGINQSYHKIPSNSPVREKWLETLKIKEYNSSIRVCSIHFQKEDFRKLGENCRKILRRNAIPSKLLTVKFSDTIFAQTMQKGWKKCCVCGTKDGSLTYHSFPSEPNLRKQWADACGFKDHLSIKTKQICGKHFRPEDYNYCMKIDTKADKSRRTLRKNVVPSLLLDGNANERKNTIISIPPPFKALAPNSVSTLVLKNVNELSSLTIPPTFAPVTTVNVNPAVLSSLNVLLGDQNVNRKEAAPKITQANSLSTSATTQDNEKGSTLFVKPAQNKSPIVVELSDSDGDVNIDKSNAAPTNSSSSASTKTNSSVLAKNNPSTLTQSESNNLETDKDKSDDEDSNFSIEELILEEPLSSDENENPSEENEVPSEENEVNSNSESNNQPVNVNIRKSTPAIRPSLPTKYRPILPAPTLTLENIKLIEALALKNGFRTADQVLKPMKPGPALLWRYPSDIGPAHCSNPANAWKAVQLLQSTVTKQKSEIKALQQFKRRTLIKMQKMSHELQAYRKKHKPDSDDVEPWWV